MGGRLLLQRGVKHKKRSPEKDFFCFLLALKLFGHSHAFHDGNELTVFVIAEFYNAVSQSEQRIVFTDPNVLTGVNFGASLSYENAAGKYFLTIGTLHTESFRLAVSAVVGRTGTFLMSE
jgi:hypothetical protein